MAFLLVLSLVTTFVDSSLSSLQQSCHNNEKSALLQFKRSFIINCAVSDSAYTHPKTSSWDTDDEDCCLWDGVTCNNETGHVIGLDLSDSCLYGSFPPNTTLFNIPYLEELNLAFNNFNHSPICPGLGHKLGKLTSLNLSASAFSGQVPLDISELSNLSLLDLSHNYGLELKVFSLQRLVRNLTHLTKLILDSLDISSPVPNLLANLTSLSSISLEFCNLLGEFPSSIFRLPRLKDLKVGGNINLKGVLPMFEHTSLIRSLSVYRTSFLGELPPSIGSLEHLEQLSLSNCRFSGQVPSSLGNLTKLSILQLNDNDFSGDIPSSYMNLTHLHTLAISNLNASSNKLFLWLSKLNNLLSLELPSMNLAGEIPAFLANFTSLETLNLSENDLVGHVPHWLINLTHLDTLSLSKNHLEGSVPPGMSHLGRLYSLDLSENVNLRANFNTLLKLQHMKILDLSSLTLAFDSNIPANKSLAKFNDLSLNFCQLTEFPSFLSSQDELQILLLQNNRIQGVIPLWLVNVTRDNLLLLDLSYNHLTGFEQPTKVIPWVNLKLLLLDGNKIEGSLLIPSNSMLMYGVYNNSFTGDIPLDICQASSLIYLDLSYNQLSGQIPECIVHLGSSLQILDIGGNTFRGTIPSGYPKSSKLKMINLNINQLSGNLPRSLANCKMLEVLDVGSNQISDTFPSWLSSLPNLQILVLRHNSFHGRIGSQNDSFGFHSLRIMDLSHNYHTGSLPTDYIKMWDAMKVASEAQSATFTTSIIFILRTSTRYVFQGVEYDYTTTISNKGNDMLFMKMQTVFRLIDFSSNNFTGRIPNIIGDLKGLQAINLSNNNLDGGIPPSLANIRDLQSLDLSNNKLTGKIPQQLAHTTYLEIFNVSHNLLVGPIPQGNQFDTFDNSSFDGNLGLCGGTLSKKCRKVSDPPPSASVTKNDDDDNSYVVDWIIRSLGCATGLGIGFAIGKYLTDKNHELFVVIFRGRRRRTYED